MSLLPLATGHPSDVLDMPVDPNEPTYCLCHQVSYGEMIGCDNQDVSLHHFHISIRATFVVAMETHSRVMTEMVSMSHFLDE